MWASNIHHSDVSKPQMGIFDGAFFFFTHAARWSLSFGVAAVRSNSVLWGRFSKTISLQGYKGWMKSQGVASIMLRPKIPFWGSFTVKNFLSDFPQQICLCVSILSLRRECFNSLRPYCPGRRYFGQKTSAVWAFKFHHCGQTGVEGGGSMIKLPS